VRDAAGPGTRTLARRVEPWVLVTVWAALTVLFWVLRPGTFMTEGNWANMLASQASLVVLTLGLIIPLTAGEYDVSVGSVAGFSAMVLAVLNVNHNVPLIPAMIVAILAGAVSGLVSGTVVVYFGIDSLIVTLGVSNVLSGLTLWISGSNTITGVTSTLTRLTITDRLFGIPYEFYGGVILTVLTWIYLEHTASGRRLLVVGRSREVARLAGMRVGAARIGAFVAAAVFASLAGIIIAGTTGSADPSNDLTLTLPAMAGAFLGATTIRPGRFNAWGVLAAVYFLVTGVTGLQLLGAQTFIQDIFYGAVLVVAVVFSQMTRGRRAAISGT
jgi:ribose transport system permease protein